MVRTFATHRVRESKEISGCLWNFRTAQMAEDEAWEKVPVPGCWENFPGTENYRGKAEYTRIIEAQGNIRLEFKGVSHSAEIYLDDQFLGRHYNAYTPFEVVAENLPEGQHLLRVEVDNSFSEKSALHVPNDYQSYGGISRAVVQEKLRDVYIRWMHIAPQRTCRPDGRESWSINAEICLKNISDVRFTGTTEIFLEDTVMETAEIRLEGKEEKVICLSEICCGERECWCPENPKLYEVTACLNDKDGKHCDDLIDRIGFREVRADKEGILLNGKKLRIKGACRHEDHPHFGCALPYAAMEYDVMLIRDLHMNAVRTSHYPNDEIFLDLCDEQGILIWEENHARGLSEEQMRNPEFERQCEDCINEMITAHYNHPSVFIWGILNECASHTEYGRGCYQKQYELIRKKDSSRLMSSASCQFKTDICFDLPDVVSYNIYPLWYHDTPVKEYLDDLYEWVQKEGNGAGKPFLITETGAGGLYGYRTPAHVKWSEEYQAQALRQQLEAILEKKECSGVFIWQFCDTRVCDSWFGVRPRTMNNKGITDEYRRPKLAYETVKEIFGQHGNYMD